MTKKKDLFIFKMAELFHTNSYYVTGVVLAPGCSKDWSSLSLYCMKMGLAHNESTAQQYSRQCEDDVGLLWLDVWQHGGGGVAWVGVLPGAVSDGLIQSVKCPSPVITGTIVVCSMACQLLVFEAISISLFK